MTDPKGGHPPSTHSSAATAPSSSSPDLSPDLGLDRISLETTRSVPAGQGADDPFSPLEEALASPDQEAPYERLARQTSTARSRSSSSSSDHAAQHSDRLSRAHTGTTSIASHAPGFEVLFGGDADSPASPRTWPLLQRAWIIFCVSFSSWVIVLYSTSYTSSLPGLMAAYHVQNESVATLGVTTYLVGLAVGGLVVAPMSELFGRRPVYLVCLTCFTLLVLPTALASSLAEILVVRFFG